ncbi:hypothetical protein GCM10027276_07850 [Comamonas piscis]
MILSNKFYPIDKSIFLISGGFEELVDSYYSFLKRTSKDKGITISRTDGNLPLDDLMKKLVPLTSPLAVKFIFFQINYNWTLFINNFVLGSDVASVDYIAKALNRKFIRMTEIISTNHLGAEFESPHVGMMTLDYKDYSYDGQKETILYLEKIKGKWSLNFEKDDFNMSGEVNGKLSEKEQMKMYMDKLISNLRISIDESSLNDIRKYCSFELSSNTIRDHREYSLKEAILR